MHRVGKINREIYKCITEDIVTDEVVITDERIAHIKERHPNDFDEVVSELRNVLWSPDYIIRDSKFATGLVIKRIISKDRIVQMVLRIHTSTDATGYKNSIISCWEISEGRLRNYLRNKEILYKRE